MDNVFLLYMMKREIYLWNINYVTSGATKSMERYKLSLLVGSDPKGSQTSARFTIVRIAVFPAGVYGING